MGNAATALFNPFEHLSRFTERVGAGVLHMTNATYFTAQLTAVAGVRHATLPVAAKCPRYWPTQTSMQEKVTFPVKVDSCKNPPQTKQRYCLQHIAWATFPLNSRKPPKHGFLSEKMSSIFLQRRYSLAFRNMVSIAPWIRTGTCSVNKCAICVVLDF